MLTYNEVLKRIEKVLDEDFGIQFDSNVAAFSDTITLNSLLPNDELTVQELEFSLCGEFDINNELETIYNEKSTIGEIANEIME